MGFTNLFDHLSVGKLVTSPTCWEFFSGFPELWDKEQNPQNSLITSCLAHPQSASHFLPIFYCLNLPNLSSLVSILKPRISLPPQLLCPCFSLCPGHLCRSHLHYLVECIHLLVPSVTQQGGLWIPWLQVIADLKSSEFFHPIPHHKVSLHIHLSDSLLRVCLSHSFYKAETMFDVFAAQSSIYSPQ